jgi:hypothetical protein
VDTKYLVEYWSNLSQEQRNMLINMPEEDFISHLDYHLKFILRICRQCRVNVMREFRLLKPGNAGIGGKHFFEVITLFHNSLGCAPSCSGYGHEYVQECTTCEASACAFL